MKQYDDRTTITICLPWKSFGQVMEILKIETIETIAKKDAKDRISYRTLVRLP